MAHPLSGADLGTLAATVARAGLPEKPIAAAAIGTACLLRWPFSTAEKLLIDRRLPDISEMPPPVFILGHWRSGTTHLYNIMVKSGDWGFVPPVATGLPWDLFGLARAFRPLLERALPRHRYIDKIPVNPDSPQEDEIAIANMSPLSFYHGIYFPRAFSELVRRGLFFDGCTELEIDGWRRRFVYFLRKLHLHQGAKRLLIKNPVYTARLALLRRDFPSAKFIHIRRNPYEVFASMRNFYRRLFEEFALQGYGHVDIDETIVEVYERMMTALARDAEGLGADQFVDLAYEDLDANPLGVIETAYRRLDLGDFEAARPRFSSYIASVSGFEKNRFTYEDEAARKVEARLGRFLRKWGYGRPGAAAPGEAGAHEEDAKGAS